MSRTLSRARTAAVAATAVLACLLLAGMAGPATAEAASEDEDRTPLTTDADQPDPAALGLEATTGYGSDSATGSWLPVEVRLSPSRPFAGELTLESHGTAGPVATSRDIEVAAGSTNVYRALLPAGRTRVVFTEDGRDPISFEPPLQTGRDAVVVGWLSDGGLPAELPSLRLDPLGQQLDWVGLDPAWLETSAYAAEPLGAIVADASTLADLTAVMRRNLVTALSMGAHLVVIAEPGDPLDSFDAILAGGLPATAAEPAEVTRDRPVEVASLDAAQAAWTLDAADVGLDGDAVLAAATDIGRGRVVVVGTSPAGPLGDLTALWEETLGPGGMRGGVGTATHMADGGSAGLAQILRTGEENVPALPGLAAFLAAYVLVVGPVNGLVLKRMGRRELAWVTVPLVTAVFTVAAFAGAVRGGDDTGVTATARWWIDGHGGELVAAGAQPPTAGAHEVAVHGTGWVAHPQAPGRGEATVSGEDPLVTEVELESFEIGGLLAWRATDEAAPLELEATATADGVDARVRNGSDRPLSDVILRAGGANTHVGELAPGESTEVTLPDFGLSQMHEPMTRPGEPLPQSMEVALLSGVPLTQPGIVWATATDDADGPSVTVDGRAPRHAGRLLAVGVRAGTDPHAPQPQAIARDLFALGDESFPDPSTADALLRFRLPAGSSPGQLRARLSDDAPPTAELALWDRADRRWVDVDGPVDADRFVSPLGVVHVRSTGGMEGEHTGTTLSGISSEEGT